MIKQITDKQNTVWEYWYREGYWYFAKSGYKWVFKTSCKGHLKEYIIKTLKLAEYELAKR